jgi:tetratricopeptide (TPR) repeat protein
MKIKRIHVGCLALLSVATGLACGGCRSSLSSLSSSPGTPTAKSGGATAPLAARELPSDAAAGEAAIRFLSLRVKSDPEDFAAQNRLAASLLQRARETNDASYLRKAEQAARASLRSVPAEVNSGGLGALAQVEFASHRFASARNHARRLTRLDPSKSEFHGMLGDALLELGRYEEASAAHGRMWGLNRQGISTQTRLARMSLLRGKTAEARKLLFNALSLSLNQPAPPRETVAWCRWQLGEVAFAVGDYVTAERHYRDAITTFPAYAPALASLGRVRAARGDIKDAIAQLEHAARIIPDPNFAAALGDLYQLSGRAKDARAQHTLVEQIGRLSKSSGALYNRQLALFRADHGLKTEQAYADAKREYLARQDIYGADAVAWTALKTGRLSEASKMMTQALRLGTRDARLFYHAGMIAHATKRPHEARKYLERALDLSPGFDPLQSRIARRTLTGLQKTASLAASGTTSLEDHHV